MQPAFNELLNSKIFVKNNLTFMPPSTLINRFLESIKYTNENIKIKTQNEVINENIEGSQNIAYPRFSLEVNKLNSPIENEINVYGLLVGMDLGKPLIKAYSGLNASSCLNLSIYKNTNLISQDLLTNLDSLYERVSKFYTEEEEKFKIHSEILNKLKNTILNDKQVDRLLGSLLKQGKSSGLGTSIIVNAADLLTDKRSIYYHNPSEDTTFYNFYNAITQGITDSNDILTKPNKTLITANLLHLLN